MEDSAEPADMVAMARTGPARTLEPAAAAEVLRGALGEHRGDLTIADAAARAGLALRDAELGLHALLRAQRGHLSVTASGELLFRFPEGLQRQHTTAMRIARAVGGGALAVARWSARIALTVFLLGYSVLFVLVMFVGAIALAFAAESEDPAVAIGYLLWHVVELLGDALYWSVHPLRAPDELDDDAAGRQPRSFYQRVNGFFLGPPRRAHDPKAAAKLLTAEIRFRRGRIGLSDVVRVTGLAPEPASALVSRLLLDYDGTVDVTDDGAIVYRFPALQPSVDAPVPTAAPAIWRRVRELPAFTGNTLGSNFSIVALTAFVAGFGYLGVWLGLPIWAAEIPLWGSVALLAMVLLRIPGHIARRRADRAENGRRALLRLAYDGACERRGLEIKEFAAAWHEATDTAIDDKQLQAMLLEIGGDLVIDDDGRTSWRFPTIELELGALARVRALVQTSEREVGAVEFTSLPAEDDEIRALTPAQNAAITAS
ncbi:MAG TPA: hypothetical protein VGB85_23790 [Nannocystis sp.]